MLQTSLVSSLYGILPLLQASYIDNSKSACNQARNKAFICSVQGHYCTVQLCIYASSGPYGGRVRGIRSPYATQAVVKRRAYLSDGRLAHAAKIITHLARRRQDAMSSLRASTRMSARYPKIQIFGILASHHPIQNQKKSRCAATIS